MEQAGAAVTVMVTDASGEIVEAQNITVPDEGSVGIEVRDRGILGEPTRAVASKKSKPGFVFDVRGRVSGRPAGGATPGEKSTVRM